jgi:hypothetical protein
MFRTIGAVAHGLIDYATVVIFAIGPTVGGFHGKQAVICYALAVVHFLLTVITRFPLGALKTVPFPVHGGIEIVVALFLIVLPWLANFSAGIHSRNFFVLIGLLIAVIWLLTDYRGPRSAGRASAAGRGAP